MQRLALGGGLAVGRGLGRRALAGAPAAGQGKSLAQVKVESVDQSLRPLDSQSDKAPAVHDVPDSRLTFDQVHQSDSSLECRETKAGPLKVTHTGQAWDASDYRLARFTEVDKQVNPNVAMHLIAGVEAKGVEERVVSCDGGGGALGHPKIYINLDKPGNHACGYCGLRFFKTGQHHDGSEHIQV